MNDTYLLKTKNAERLYRDYAKDAPIIDFHNHLSVADIATDKKYGSLYELWLATDPYKHRLMRICGVDEYFITGGASPVEKLRKFAEIFPTLAGNPVYSWGRMELSSIFGIDELLSAENADYINDKVDEMLASPEYSTRGILSRFNIEYQSPVASILDDLTHFDGRSTAPSLRGDNLLAPTKQLFADLAARTGKTITDTASYISAISPILDDFSRHGCRFADHALDSDFFETDTDGEGARILTLLAGEYKKRGWTLLLHMDAKRKTSTRLARVAGAAGGYAAVGASFPIARITDLLNGMEESAGLPDTVLFPLNIGDQAPLAVMQGSFSEDGVPSKVQLGPAWWWCDHTMGIENTLESIASFGVLSRFIGMTTDSRSILSFVRHDYFRRILCSWIDRYSTDSEWGLTEQYLGDLVRRICYSNAKEKLRNI